jgi:pimeloyl-ACP methyl ester carboxylesterase
MAHPLSFPAACRKRHWTGAVAVIAAAGALLSACATGSTGVESAAVDHGPAFYRYDAAVPSQPGKLLRQEPLPAAFGLASASQEWRILYTSTDGNTGRGQLVASGAVFYPNGPAPQGGWPVIAWAHGTVGIADRCAPSRTPRSARDARYLDAWLNQGFAVVATDYQGLGTAGPHLYLDTRAEAYAVLDAVRAALGGMKDLSNRVVLVGQSQGGGAAFATAAFAPDYAPDVHVLGTVATGTPYLQYILRSSKSPFKPDQPNPTLAYNLYLGHTVQALDPAVRPEQLYKARALPLYDRAAESCVDEMEKDVVLGGLTNANTLQPEGTKVMAHALGARIFYPTLKLAHPLFMGTGGKDKDVPTDGQLQLAKDACAAGTLVQQHVYESLDHSGTVNASLADSVPFVRQLLAGQAVASTCASGPQRTP